MSDPTKVVTQTESSPAAHIILVLNYVAYAFVVCLARVMNDGPAPVKDSPGYWGKATANTFW